MNMKIRKSVMVLMTLFFSVFTVYAGGKYSLVQDQSKLTVQGTSSVHDWEMAAEGISCDLQATYNDGKLITIDEVRFVCLAEKILSDNSIMDNKTHDALQADDHPKITFEMKSIESLNQTGSNFSGVIVGNLTIAGYTKRVQVKFNGTAHNNLSLQVKGVVSLKMSDFKIDPPTAMLGALKTGDEVSLHYDFHFKKI